MITSVTQTWLRHRSFYRPAGEVIDPRRYEVAPLSVTPARAFVADHHYLGTWPVDRFRFGLHERGGALVGVAVFAVAFPAVLAPLPAKVSVELARFVLLPSVPSNGETWFLARCFELLRRASIAGVVSFSDPVPRTDVDGETVFRGHCGRIYQASNATYVGRATPRTLHLFPDARTFSDRAAQKIRSQERGWKYAVAQLVEAGAAPPSGDLVAWLHTWLPRVTRPLRHGGNHKYLFALDPAARRVLPDSLPFPKLLDLPKQAA